MIAATTLHDLARTGNHQQVIDTVTDALDLPDLGVSTRLDLLLQRIRSKIALAHYGEAQADISTVLKEADQHGSVRHVVAACQQQALVMMRQGKLVKAAKVADKAVKLSDAEQLAESLSTLALVKNRLGDFDDSQTVINRAIEHLAAHPDEYQRGVLYWITAANWSRKGRTTAAIAEARKVLPIARRQGDYGLEGRALAEIAQNSVDMSDQITYYTRARLVFRQSGDVYQLVRTTHNLGTVYIELGLNRQAHRLLMAGVPVIEQIGASTILAYTLDNLIVLEAHMGHIEAAQSHLDQLSDMVDALGDQLLLSVRPLRGLEIALAQQDYEAMVHMAHEALAIDRKHDQVLNIALALGRLVQGHLGLGDADKALPVSREMIAIHKTVDYASLETIRAEEMWWIHHQALAANRHVEEATQALMRAYQFLVDAITKMGDVGLRRNFLNKLPFNRAILQAVTTLDPVPTMHLQGPHNPRDPFHRLANTGMRLNALRDSDDLHTFLIEEATELSGAERVMLLMGNDTDIKLVGAVHPGDEPITTITPAIHDMIEQARRTRRTHLIMMPENAAPLQQRSAIIAPLMASSRILGYLYADMDGLYGRFDDSDRDGLSLLANQAGVALENAGWVEQLEQRVEQRTKELLIRMEQMRALNEVGKDISATLELDTVLDSVTRHAARLVGGDAGAMWVVEDDGEMVKVITAVGDIAEPLQGFSVPYGSGIVGSTIEKGQATRVEDTNTDPRGVHIEGTKKNIEGERLMVTPLMHGDTAIGALSVWRNPGEPAFSEDELIFLTGLAQQAVIAVQNARLFEEAEKARMDAEISRAEAIRANEAKSSFLTNMSHELRTPLNAIIGFSRIVQRKINGKVEDKQVENVDKVLDSANHLLGLINTILDIAKIEAGRMDVVTTHATLASVVTSCADTTRPLLKPGVELTTSIPDVDLYTDVNKLRQILLNLLSNAAKFTGTGSISVKAYVIAGQVIIDVEDTGIGMTEEALARVFDAFQQADSSTTREYGGTGLGLSISRNLAELLGGSLVASSTRGVGSTFTLIIPAQYGDEGEMVHTPRPKPPKRQTKTGAKPIILSIDDDPDVLYLLQEGLAKFEVVGVTDSAEGLALARALQPFAITLDINLGDVDGWKVLKQLKGHKSTQDIPVIIISIVDNKSTAYQLGATDYLVKPFDEADIRRILTAMMDTDINHS